MSTAMVKVRSDQHTIRVYKLPRQNYLYTNITKIKPRTVQM